MHFSRPLLSICLLLLGQNAQGSRPNDKVFTAEEVEKYGCGKSCQEGLRVGMKQDRDLFQDYPFDYEFYATASNFSDANPGDVLKLELYNVSTLSVPSDITAYKIQYVSVGLHDEKVPATAFLTLPYTADYGEKPRLVAFAHGTIGTVPSCAPSSSYNFYDYYTWQTLAVAGYAVVGTDYAGLGNNYTSHKYVNPVLNGEDVYWSVVAARRAFPNTFSMRWASLGHSQGGGAVWGLSENPRVRGSESGEYIGGVAIAPSPRIYDLSKLILDIPEGSGEGKGSSSFVPLIQEAVQEVNPPNTEMDFILEKAQQRYPLAEKLQLCLHGAGGMDRDLPFGGMNRSAIADNKLLDSFQRSFGAATGKKGFRDLLVLQATGDKSANYNVTETAYHVACDAGNVVQMSLYQGLDHRPVLTASAPEFLQWFDKRYRGEQAPQKCQLREVKPLGQ